MADNNPGNNPGSGGHTDEIEEVEEVEEHKNEIARSAWNLPSLKMLSRGKPAYPQKCHRELQ
jgi:hypothetical protein